MSYIMVRHIVYVSLESLDRSEDSEVIVKVSRSSIRRK